MNHSAVEPTSEALSKRRLSTIFVTVFIDVLGFGLILPLLPYYATRFGADAVAIGLLTAAYPADPDRRRPAVGSALRPLWPTPDSDRLNPWHVRQFGRCQPCWVS
nr:MFS transporter [Propionibacterium sp.]